MSKKNIYHINLNTNKKDFGYLKHESTGKYYKILYRTNHGFSENSYYEVCPMENGQEVETKELLSVSSEAVDFGFFTHLTTEEFKLEYL
jgi:Trm5-related predicted tRNA methylase